MKKIIILLLAVLTVSGCSKQSINNSSNNSTDSTPTNDIAETLEINVSADYAYLTPEQLNDHCSLIIVGTLQNVNNNFVNNKRIFENSTIKVDKILKGDYKKGTIKVNYAGGQVTYEEYINAVGKPVVKTPNVASEYASEYAAEMANPPEYKYVKMAETKESVKAKKDQQYLFFLNKKENEQDDENYFVMADAYGMRPIKDGKAFNPDTEQYETISFLNLN